MSISTREQSTDTKVLPGAEETVIGEDELNQLLENYNLDQAELFTILNELINNKLNSLCKKYCFNNRFQYHCTIDLLWGLNEPDNPLCEWGNASYAWILDELTHDNRLKKIQGENNSSITRYFSKIIHSIAFIERFKNWRFQRRIRVPEYIKAIDIDAHKVFWGLCDNDQARNIAQRLGRDEQDVSEIIKRINEELVKRKRSHLLDLTQLSSLSSRNDNNEQNDEVEISFEDKTYEQFELESKVKDAYDQLTWLEQYIIDAMVIDGLSAKSVLDSLIKQNIVIDEKVKPADMNIQHVYYFFRKTLAKLKETTGIR
ncbi:hypothetical protein [Kaarinaea lacus]